MPVHAPTALFTNKRFSHLWLYRDQKQSSLDSCLHSARSLFFFFFRNIIAQKLSIFNETIIIMIVGSQYWTVRHTWKIIYSIGTFSVGWRLILRLIILTMLILIIIQARIIPDDPYTYLIRIPSVGIPNDIIQELTLLLLSTMSVFYSERLINQFSYLLVTFMSWIIFWSCPFTKRSLLSLTLSWCSSTLIRIMSLGYLEHVLHVLTCVFLLRIRSLLSGNLLSRIMLPNSWCPSECSAT